MTRRSANGGPSAAPPGGPGARAEATATSGGGSGGGTLFVVATPIGNLGDVTLRSLEVLRAVPLVACEDTRITRRLLARHGIDGRLTSFHAHSDPGRLEALLGHLRGGADLALTTDAGTPGISDPGDELVRAWGDEGGRVVPIPGASAALAAVMASGIAGPRWTFEGFLPRSGRERRERLARIAADERGSVLYEGPARLESALRDLAAACGGDRPAAVCRELTKLHESIVRGSLDDLTTMTAQGDIPQRGEIAIVVGAHSAGPRHARGEDRAEPRRSAAAVEEARASVEALVSGGSTRTAAARHVAERTGISRRELYRSPSD